MIIIQKGRLYALLFFVITIIGTIFFSIYKNRNTATLFFQTKSDGSIVSERRYISKTHTQSDAVILTDELLLGPMDHGLLRFTDPDVNANSCFIRSDCLYLDLPAKVLTPKEKTTDFKIFYTLLKKTIATNAKNIKTIYLFIDGVPAYQNKPTDDKESIDASHHL